MKLLLRPVVTPQHLTDVCVMTDSALPGNSKNIPDSLLFFQKGEFLHMWNTRSSTIRPTKFALMHKLISISFILTNRKTAFNSKHLK